MITIGKEYPLKVCGKCHKEFKPDDTTENGVCAEDAKEFGIKEGEHLCMNCIVSRILDDDLER
ncbi:MAG: hypothetical protein WC375_06115 [Methanomassiliicoccales archaeon]|jgi:hypothetical protein